MPRRKCPAPACKFSTTGRVAELTKHKLTCTKYSAWNKAEIKHGFQRLTAFVRKRQTLQEEGEAPQQQTRAASEDEDVMLVDHDPPTPLVRRRRAPKSITDHLPIPPLGVMSSVDDDSWLPNRREPPTMNAGSPTTNQADKIWTLPNKFGILRCYFDVPSSIPDEDVTLPELTNPVEPLSTDDDSAPTDGDSQSNPQTLIEESLSKKDRILNIIYPHPNLSAFLMNVWFYRRGSMQKSKLDRNILIKDVVLNPAFDPSHLEPPFSFNTLDDAIVNTAGGITSPEQLGVGWIKSDVVMDIPAMGQHPRTTWAVPGAYYRDMTEIARRVLEDQSSTKFNYDGFEEWWQPPSTDDTPLPRQRVYHNVYSADAFLQAEAQLRLSQPRDYVGLPRRIVGLMFWSDSTHLTDFGQASLHPIYMAFVNQSKADRCHPNKRCLHHIAYMPELPAELIAFLTDRLGKAPNSDLLAHLKQELFQAVWRLLLNDAFMKAHEHGMDLLCGDRIQRLVYLRVFIYSADCPERAAICCIRVNGTCACFNDNSKKAKFDSLGTLQSRLNIIQGVRRDSSARRNLVLKARRLIYDQGRGVKAKEVENLLKKSSWTPTLVSLVFIAVCVLISFRSAFSERIGPLNPSVDTFKMVVCDRMHEWESGTVKRAILHLFRMLLSISPQLLVLLDERFRSMPSFGSRIRKFPPSVSQAAQLAARDWENILICAIPAFTGILLLQTNHAFEAEQKLVLDMLYVMGTFHTLSQLRLQTSHTLELLKDATIALGEVLREFREMSNQNFKVKESQRETQARVRNQNRALQNRGSKKTASSSESKQVVLNLNTIKNHMLEHYAPCIADFGTMDSYSTELGEREHCFSKMRFLRTNKHRHTFVQGMAREETIERRIAEMEMEIHQLQQENLGSYEQPEPAQNLSAHYSVAESSRNIVSIPQWLGDNATDPAFTRFLPNLKDHILRRLRRTTHRLDDDFTYSLKDHADLYIKNNQLRFHQTMRINYTTYDIRRDADSITTTHPNIMLLANEDLAEDVHPYWYARVIKIFHVDVMDRASPAREYHRVNVLWVRWYGQDADSMGGWKQKRLLRVGYVQGPEHGFGFVDPSEVIRGCYLLPLREFQYTTNLLNPPSKLASDDPIKGDFPLYNIIHWVDPDMFMRYCGGGPGHLNVPTCTTAWKLQSSALPQQPSDPVPLQPEAHTGSNALSSSSDGEDTDDYAPGLSDSGIYLE